jgi:hypothetical protein
LAVFFFDAGTGSDCQIARFTSDGGEFNAPITEAFTVGDPAYKTQIDGTAICIEGSVGINWDDTEFLALDAAVGISSEWGSNLNTDWSSAGVVAATAALESTGILQDSSFGMDGFDVSDDGLHAIMCEQSGDRIVAYDLDSP